MTDKSRIFLLAAFVIPLVANSARAQIDYFDPPSLTGTVYADASLKNALFTFHRTATKSGSAIHVVREFNSPDGQVAAREKVEYENGQLQSFTLEEFQTGAKGIAVVQSDGADPKLDFHYTEGTARKNGREKFLSDILVSDMVGPYMSAHWDALAAGETVRCRLVAVQRAETVGFKFFKEADSTWHGQPVMIVTLKPSSFLISKLVDPLHFVIEKTGTHRILQYTGRTTPDIRKNGKWQDLDGVTVFDWK